MKIKDILLSRDHVISFEFFPPKDEKVFDNFINSFDFYSNLHPDFVSITYGAGGSTKSQTYELVKFVKENYKIPVMPHLTSLTHSKEEIYNILSSYKKIGIANILALRGDVPKDAIGFDISCVYFKNALILVEFIRKNFGDEFGICVSAYPEGYPDYKNIPLEVDYLKSKFESGGDFAITQMFFDNKFFYDFMEVCRKKSIKNEIIPGIMPITNFRQISSFATKVGTSIPKHIVDSFSKYLDDAESSEKLGIEIALEQIYDLFDNGFKKVHIYTLNRRSVIQSMVLALKTRMSLLESKSYSN
ncbi:MAG: methylenetetrahydrofolate reductase [Brevinematales bacterium]|nr:methylenetetrahydrofolate reductase [Brevinematales bacterium]